MSVTALTEKDWQRQVIELAGMLGYRHYHTHDSRRSPHGFPDLVFVSPLRGRVIFAELKSERGKPSAEQEAWLRDLERAGAEAYLWRPGDLDEVGRVLAGAHVAAGGRVL